MASEQPSSVNVNLSTTSAKQDPVTPYGRSWTFGSQKLTECKDWKDDCAVASLRSLRGSSCIKTNGRKEYPSVHVAIVGTRTFSDEDLFWTSLADEFGPNDILITGDAQGTDELVRRIFRDEYNHPVIVLKAEWDKFGRSAGPIRNERIMRLADRVIAFWDNKSPGTRNAIEQAKERGLPIKVIDIGEKNNG